MTIRPSRLGPASGILLTLFWVPMAIALAKLPDLDSAAEVETFWRQNTTLMQIIICSASVGFLFLLIFLGALVDYLQYAAGSPTLVWTAFGSALMFMTALNIALGLDIAGGLMLSSSAEGTYVLHTAGFLLAAPAAFAGASFFVAIAVITFTDRDFPPWSGCLAVIGAIANVGAVGGIFALRGPLNSGNGLIGGIAAPLGLYLLWILAISVWWLRHDSTAGSVRNRIDVG